jgi:hypothetical protein
MSHPYLTRCAQITVVFAILLVFGTVWAVVLRSPAFAISGAAAAAVLLALAAFQGWLGLFMFIVAVIGMVVIVLWHVLHGYRI